MLTNSDLVIADFSKEHRFLSNFCEIADGIVYDGLRFSTTEAAYQAAKAEPSLASTLDLRKVFAMCTAREAKFKSGTVTLRKDWESVKVPIMRDLLKLKFSQFWFGEKLRATGDALLIGGNYWHDNTWGVCMCPKCRYIPGRNLLGVLLMEVRQNLPLSDTYKEVDVAQDCNWRSFIGNYTRRYDQ